jgi:AbrB family looped-hinge helix DNA binding protein
MRVSIDPDGRLVIPRAIREQVGLTGATEVEVDVQDGALRVTAVTGEELTDEDGRLVIASTGLLVTADIVERLRDDDRR